MYPKIFLGPMSKNIVDTVIDYSNSFKLPFTFIPSRRQIEYNGGYVNNWTTKSFTEYVKNKSKYISIERDHGGIGQGTHYDDGLKSYEEDCKYLDIIHIDPWKKYQNYNDGLNETIKTINYCYNKNCNLYFEIATEEGIRKFEVNELEKLILDLKTQLKPEIYNRIKYLVIQCGTGLLEGKNIGNYDKIRLYKMLELCKKYNLISKEHNGDWVSIELMKEKFNLGLECINIAPELGQIETKTILNIIKKLNRSDLFEKYYQICLDSKKWVKWVNEDFIPDENKEKLINICGHYVFSNPEFIKIKNELENIELENIELEIKKNILIKLREYHSLYDNYYKVLITTSGVGSRLGEITQYTNKSLVKVGDKLAICHIIEKYNKYVEFVITLGYYGKFVKDFLELAYPNHCFNFVWVDNYNGVGSSLAYSLLKAKDKLNCPFIFNCCDSITKDNIIIPNENILFVFASDNNVLYSTVNVSNSNIKNINNKKERNFFDFIYTGISFIKNYTEYWNILEKIYNENNDIELGDVQIIQELLKHNIFKYIELKSWYDSGNLIELNKKIKYDFKTKYEVLNKYDENICFIDNFVIKFFYNETTNKNRVIRGKFLYPLTPKIYDYRDNYIKMELIDGELVSKIKTHGEIKNLLKWSNLNLWKNTNIQTNNFKNICKTFYYDKTLNRINKILETVNDYNIINDLNIGSIHDLLKKINFDSLFTNDYTNFHGDFILDNIIKINNDYKLLDWRQDFGGELYNGDKYYDLAKLRHNIILNHENLNNNLFTNLIRVNKVYVDLKCNFTLINQLQEYEDFIKKNNYDLNKIKILTSLIWLNMSPLHEYPLNEFLYYFGKYNLFLEISNYH